MSLQRRVFGSVILLVVVGLIAGCLSAGRAANEDGEGSEMPSIAVTGTKWDLVELEGMAVTGPGPATLDFDKGQAGGIAFCNNFSAPYEVEGASLSFGMMVSTLMLCPEAGPETEYLDALRAVAEAAIEDGRLVLSDETGKVRLVYTPAKDVPLEGTRWLLTGILENGGVSSLVLDTEITAVLSEGQLSGSAGCNQYSAPITVEGRTVSIGPAASTRMFCAEPEGVMEQEQAYLAALEQAVQVEISRETLKFTNADGLPLLTFTASAE